MLNDFRAVVRNRDFMIALAGRSASMFGDEMALVALTLRLQASGGRPYQVAVLLAAGLVPFVLLARVAGRVADSVDSRRVLVCTSLAQACCCLPLVVTGNVAVMAVFAGLLGCAAAFAQATWQALIPRIVGEDAIGAATATQQTSVNLASVLAPAAAGLLAGAFGTRVPVAVDAVTFVVMTIAAVAVRTRRAGGRLSGQRGERGGWALLRADPVLAPLVLGLAAFVLLGFTVNVITVFLVRQTLHASASWYGGIGAVWVLGVVAGALISARVASGLGRSPGSERGTGSGGAAGAGRAADSERAGDSGGAAGSGRAADSGGATGSGGAAGAGRAADSGYIRAALAGTGLMSLAFAGYGLAPAVALLVPVAVIGGVGNGLANVCIATLVLTRSQERVRGRVMAALGATVNAASVASLLVGGGLAAVLSPRQIFLLSGALGALVTLATVIRVPGAVSSGSKPHPQAIEALPVAPEAAAPASGATPDGPAAAMLTPRSPEQQPAAQKP